MNAESTVDLPEIEATQIDHADPSEASSASPEDSGSSEMHDGISSVETTPPPMGDEYPVLDSKRFSTSSAGFSRSYRSAASSSFVDSVFSPGLYPQRLSGIDFRPTTSGTDDGSLAAATAGLNFGGTPRTRASAGDDIPPVPPLPPQYQSYSKTSTLNHVHDPFMIQPPQLTQQISDERDYKGDHDDRSEFAHGHGHLEEEGMFRMDQ